MTDTNMITVAHLSRDLAAASATLGRAEARYLVDAYYSIQHYRTAAANQQRALSASGEPHAVVTWLAEQHSTLESQIQRALRRWAEAQPVGRWSMSICGIGPVISAGLLAWIDIERAPTVGKRASQLISEEHRPAASHCKSAAAPYD